MKKLSLGQKIKLLRLEKKMTQKTLAGSTITRNMLSQIENDLATPSVKTLEYLAGRLEKPVGYFLDEEKLDDDTAIIKKLLKIHESKDYERCHALLEKVILEHPKLAQNQVIMDIFINCHMLLGEELMNQGKLDSALEALGRILQYEQYLLIMSDVYLYKVYDKISEVQSLRNNLVEAKLYADKSRELLSKLVADREVQDLYVKLLEGDLESAEAALLKIEPRGYDAYNMARYQMALGNMFMRKENFEEAITVLEKAKEFYVSNDYKTMAAVVYEDLSKCYFEMSSFKLAYDYLKKSSDCKKV